MKELQNKNRCCEMLSFRQHHHFNYEIASAEIPCPEPAKKRACQPSVKDRKGTHGTIPIIAVLLITD